MQHAHEIRLNQPLSDDAACLLIQAIAQLKQFDTPAAITLVCPSGKSRYIIKEVKTPKE